MAEPSPTDYAFPKGGMGQQVGITKAEYFAGIALQGLLSNPSITENLAHLPKLVQNAKRLGTEMAAAFSDPEQL